MSGRDFLCICVFCIYWPRFAFVGQHALIIGVFESMIVLCMYQLILKSC